MKSIKGIQPHFQEVIDKTTKELLTNAGFSTEGIKGHVCDVRQGRAYLYERAGTFSVPLWAIRMDEDKPGYFIYYVAHELSHVIEILKQGDEGRFHNKDFYRNFRKICPPSFQKYELNYKKSAANFGISE